MSRVIDRASAREKNREEHDRLRLLANQEAEERRRISNRSKEAYQSGNYVLANKLSEESNRHSKKMRKYNRLARDSIFESQNPPDQALDLIDLHGLRVKEAEKLLLQWMSEAKAEGVERLVVIVGKGNHSVNGVPKIKPAVEEICRDRDLTCIPSYFNEGRVEILLKDYRPENEYALDTSDSDIDLSETHSSYGSLPWSTPPVRHYAYFAYHLPSPQYDDTNHTHPGSSLESAGAYTHPQPSLGYGYDDLYREEEKSFWEKFLSRVGTCVLLSLFFAFFIASPVLFFIALAFGCLYNWAIGKRS